MARVADESIPAVRSAINISSASLELATLVPSLGKAIEDSTRTKTIEAISSRTAAILLELNELKKLNQPTTEIQIIEQTVSKLSEQIKLADSSIAARIQIEKARKQKMSEVAGIAEKFSKEVVTILDEATFNITVGLTSIDPGRNSRQIANEVAALSDEFSVVQSLFEAKSEFETITQILEGTSDIVSASSLRVAVDKMEGRSAKMLRALDQAQKNRKWPGLAEAAARVVELGRGGDSIIAGRSTEIELENKAGQSIAQSLEYSNELTAKTKAIVSHVSGNADAAAQSSKSAVKIGGVLLALVAFCGILAALAIALFYVGPSIVQKIVGLTETMDRLTRRDWAAEVSDIDRPDEIGDMARAVQIFKNNGMENEALQKKINDDQQLFEVQRQQQEQLIDVSVGMIVSAAVAGDFSRRIELAPLNGVMANLGRGVNTLLEQVSLAIEAVNLNLDGMAKGDMRVRMKGEYTGIFSQLQKNLNETANRLSLIVGRISDSAQSVRLAASDMSAGSNELAARTEQQAAKLEQTAAAMQEVTATVKQNANNADIANKLAAAARDSASNGGKVVADVVSAMQEIEKSAQSIGEIVSLIDEIAFQTNLLALNASVEAARAGDAGKGFAVVAQEVRSLAQRSAKASEQIKGLIRQSSEEVEEGVTLVRSAGSALEDIVVSVKKVADIVSEISAASRDQASGLDEINSAIAGIDEITQQNGALVERTTGSAQTMAMQAEELTEMIVFFKL